LVVGFAAGFAIAVLVFAAILTFDHYTSDAVVGATPTTVPQAASDTTVTPSTTATEPVIDAVALTASLGCTACHSIDGTVGVGPSWQGVAGSERTFEDGTATIADEAYLLESILDPSVKIVAGFPPVMPEGLATDLSDAQMEALVSYIQSLG
jgi:cytochrome c oxidase subunit 2